VTTAAHGAAALPALARVGFAMAGLRRIERVA